MTSYTERSEAMMQMSRGLRKLGFASLLFFTSIVVPLRSVPQMHMSIETGSRLSTSLVVPLAEA